MQGQIQTLKKCQVSVAQDLDNKMRAGEMAFAVQS